MKPAPIAVPAARVAVFSLLAMLGAFASACASADVAQPGGSPLDTLGRIARVDVAFAEADLGGLAADEAVRAAGVVRQSARDWLEHEGRLREDGDLAVTATLDALHLRANTTTWLFAWATAPDHLGARVVVRRAGEPVADFPIQVESALSGYSWRDRDERLERLARRLGHRIAARLAPGAAASEGDDAL
jgi:hypothetical protein